MADGRAAAAAAQPAGAADPDTGAVWCAADGLPARRILAPMVRVNTLPFRLLAARYGAEVVFSEELIAQKVAKCERVVDTARGVVEYVLHEQTGKVKARTLKRSVVFATPLRADRRERPEGGAHVVLQLGANSAEAALRAARLVERDVDGVDLNMGCPKAFSVKGGMGAALLTQPGKVRDILTALAGGLSVPVSCKVRLLEDPAQFAALLDAVAGSGVRCLTVHARYPPQRSSEAPHYGVLAAALRARAAPLPFPVLLSGDVWGHAAEPDTARRVREATVAGAIVARGALLHPAVFADAPGRPGKVEAHQELMRYQLRHSGQFPCMKYVLTRSFQELKEHAGLYQALVRAKTATDLCEALGMAPDEAQRLAAAWLNPLQIIAGEVDADGVPRPDPPPAGTKRGRSADAVPAAAAADGGGGAASPAAKRDRADGDAAS